MIGTMTTTGTMMMGATTGTMMMGATTGTMMMGATTGTGTRDGDGDGDGDGDDDDDFNALNNTSLTEQRTWGTSLQATRTFARGRAIFGASYDKGRAHFRSASELATLTGDRGTEGSGIFDPDAFVDLRTRVRHGGIYAAVHLDLGPSLRAQLSGRYNRSAITLLDQLGTALNGDHRFSRFKPLRGPGVAPRHLLRLRQLQPEFPGPDPGRTHLCRSGRSLPPAQRLRRRPSLGAGGDRNLGIRRPAVARRGCAGISACSAPTTATTCSSSAAAPSPTLATSKTWAALVAREWSFPSTARRGPGTTS